jgi:predicted metal-dependent peptidase
MSQIDTPVMNRRQLEAHYRGAFDWLDNNYAYFVTNVLSIGRPAWTSEIPTAAVGLQEAEENYKKAKVGQRHETDFEFLFNPAFASKLDTRTMAFVLAHEAMHISLNHLKLSDRWLDKDERKRLIDKYQAWRRHEGERLTRDEIKSMVEQQQIAKRLNFAMDAVINDYLAQAGFHVDGFVNKDGKPCAIRGESLIGEDCAFLTVTEVMDRLEDQEEEQGDCDSCDGTGEQSDEDGNGTGEPCPDCEGTGSASGDARGEGAMDSHDWMLDPEFADMMADAIDKAMDEIEKAQNLPPDLQDKKDAEDGQETAEEQALNKAMQAGSEEGNIREFQEVHGLSMAWIKLLQEVDPDIFKEPGLAPPPVPDWRNRPRKLGAFSRDQLNLPTLKQDVRQEKKSKTKPAIVIALDYSGSIGAHDADRFATLAKSIPQERIKLFACTFTTTYREFDIENPHGGGIGGTNFEAIVQFINDKVRPELDGAYPKAVVVITDGCASIRTWPTAEESESWYWLLSPDNYYDYYEKNRGGGYKHPVSDIGRRAKLSDYVDDGH